MKTRFTYEHLLFALALILAVGVRFWNLGAAPLIDSEARLASQALDLSRGEALALGAHPAYLVLLAALFGVIEATNGLARLFPALAGSLVVLLPFFFKNRGISRNASLLLAYGLALDPGLVTLSRQAGSIIPAVVFGLLALGAIYTRRPILAGVFGGLALLSGPGILAGAVGLATAFGLAKLLEKAEWLAPLWPDETPAPPLWREQNQLKTALLSGGIVFLVAGVFFFRYPQGLAALANTLSTYLAGWTQLSSIPPMRLIVAIAVYQPMALIFGLIGAVRAWVRPEPVAQRLSLWLVTALLLAVLYPARQVSDLAWALIPLWALAALEITRLAAIAVSDRPLAWIAGIQAGFLFIMAIVLRINLLAWQNLQLEVPTLGLLLAGILLVVVIATVLVAVSWSLSLARAGVVWGICASLLVGQISAMWGAAQLRQNSAAELWTPAPGAGQTQLLVQTLESLSEWETGYPDQIEVMVASKTEQPALRWALRNYPLRFVGQLSKEDQPVVVITTQDQTDLSLAASYRGQDFTAWESPGWEGALPPDWLSWLSFRQAPLAKSNLILWARVDLFPDGVLTTQEGQPSTAPEEQLPANDIQP